MIRMRGDEALQRDHERRDAAFHVGGAAAVQQAVADLGTNGSLCPGLARAGRHDVGMAEQHQRRRAAAVRRPQVVDVAEAQVLACGSPRAAGARRSAAWQPASSGVTERRAIRSLVRSSTSLIFVACVTDSEALLEAVVAEALAHRAIVGDHHRAADQLRIFLQQQLPLRRPSPASCGCRAGCARWSRTC